jgi:hypothetical protein
MLLVRSAGLLPVPDRLRAERVQCPVVEYRTERSEGGYAAKAGHGACAANYDRRTGRDNYCA